MKVFITGGGGFLGFVIVRQLLEAGYEVVSYSRKSYPTLELPGVSQHQGNLGDFAALKLAMERCEAVFHVAAHVGMWGDYEDFHATNVVGTPKHSQGLHCPWHSLFGVHLFALCRVQWQL